MLTLHHSAAWETVSGGKVILSGTAEVLQQAPLLFEGKIAEQQGVLEAHWPPSQVELGVRVADCLPKRASGTARKAVAGIEELYFDPEVHLRKACGHQVRPWISDVVDLDAGAFSQVRIHNLTHEIEVVRQMSFKPQLHLILGRDPAGCCYSSVTQCPAKAYRRVRKRAGHRLIVA